MGRAPAHPHPIHPIPVLIMNRKMSPDRNVIISHTEMDSHTATGQDDRDVLNQYRHCDESRKEGGCKIWITPRILEGGETGLRTKLKFLIKVDPNKNTEQP